MFFPSRNMTEKIYCGRELGVDCLVVVHGGAHYATIQLKSPVFGGKISGRATMNSDGSVCADGPLDRAMQRRCCRVVRVEVDEVEDRLKVFLKLPFLGHRTSVLRALN